MRFQPFLLRHPTRPAAAPLPIPQVNIARVYNYDIKLRRAAKAAGDAATGASGAVATAAAAGGGGGAAVVAR